MLPHWNGAKDLWIPKKISNESRSLMRRQISPKWARSSAFNTVWCILIRSKACGKVNIWKAGLKSLPGTHTLTTVICTRFHRSFIKMNSSWLFTLLTFTFTLLLHYIAPCVITVGSDSSSRFHLGFAASRPPAYIISGVMATDLICFS